MDDPFQLGGRPPLRRLSVSESDSALGASRAEYARTMPQETVKLKKPEEVILSGDDSVVVPSEKEAEEERSAIELSLDADDDFELSLGSDFDSEQELDIGPGRGLNQPSGINLGPPERMEGLKEVMKSSRVETAVEAFQEAVKKFQKLSEEFAKVTGPVLEELKPKDAGAEGEQTLSEDELKTMSFSLFLTKRLISLGLSQKEAATKAGIPLRTFQGYFSKSNPNPSFAYVVQICNALNVDIRDVSRLQDFTWE